MRPPVSPQRDPSRREVLATGLSAAGLARLRADAPAGKYRANACVFLFLFGGPSHIDLWDMKPDAPAEVRGEFRPIATRVPGIHVCEHLPRLGRRHGQGLPAPVDDAPDERPRAGVQRGVQRPAVLTARRRPTRPAARTGRRSARWSTRYGRPRGGLPPSVVLPWYLQFPGQPRRIAGQTGGRMGERHNAFLVARRPRPTPTSRSKGLGPRRRPARGDRLAARRGAARAAGGRLRLRPPGGRTFDGNRRAVYDLLGRPGRPTPSTCGASRRRVRERYGPTTVGQSLLLARRLVEAGVSLVTVNWQDETKIDGVNTCWDTHQDNFAKLKTLLCPTFDRAFPAFVEDLRPAGPAGDDAGGGGRASSAGRRRSASSRQSSNTRKTGRDHWPHAFTALLAGGGVRGGQVYGATTRDGGYVGRQARHPGRPDGDDPAPPGDRPHAGVRGRVPALAAPAQRRRAGPRPGLRGRQCPTCFASSARPAGCATA